MLRYARRFTREQKLVILSEHLEGGVSISELSRKYQVRLLQKTRIFVGVRIVLKFIVLMGRRCMFHLYWIAMTGSLSVLWLLHVLWCQGI